MSKVYDDPKYNAAFDRCVDVMARLLQKYGPQLLEQMQETAKDGCTPVSYTHLTLPTSGLV